MVIHTYNPCGLEGEAVGSEIQGDSQLHIEFKPTWASRYTSSKIKKKMFLIDTVIAVRKGKILYDIAIRKIPVNAF